jgi:protocatechuate 3,4-dioxygenase, beta subunit
MEKSLKRRSFLGLGIGGLTAALVLPKAGAAGEMCLDTAPQTRGPFYPGQSQILPINDLTRVAGRQQEALGQKILLMGHVRDQNCQPVEGVDVEIWQACASGKYNHPNDPNPAPLDPNFAYWGEDLTNASGYYQFSTIIPGAYPAAEGWDRPPHIHFRVRKLGYRELVTQMYFEGEALNEKDLILLDIPEVQRPGVVVKFTPHIANPKILTGQFDITIQKITRLKSAANVDNK